MTSTESGDLTARPSGQSRIPALDSLRGIAILMVVASHLIPGFIIPEESALGQFVNSFGTGGVLLFFFLSGYLIFRNLHRQALPVFLARRFFKLFPAYWVNVIFVAVMGLLFIDYPHFTWPTYLINFFMLQDFFRDQNISVNYWTLVIETRFYILIALQFHFLRDRRLLALPGVVFLLNFAFWLHFGRGSVLLSYLPVFYVGTEIYRAELADWSHGAVMRLCVVTAIVAASMLMFVFHTVSSAIYIVVLAAGFVWFLRGGLYASLLGFFGRVSYSFYLYHGTLGYELFRLFKGGAIPIGAQAAMIFVITAITASLSFFFIEEPGVRLGRHIEKKLLGRFRLRAAPRPEASPGTVSVDRAQP